MQDYGPRLPVPPLSRTDRSILRGTVNRAKTASNEERDLERDSWWRTMSASLSFIKFTNLCLEAAERKIAEQAERIEQLEQLATMDELTGLMNRRGFYDAFLREIDRTTRGHSHGGLLIVIDLDNFKMVNDTHGHLAGDAALRLVAKTLKGNSRIMDACGRLGGDEFVLLLANTERDKALVRAQNLIKQLNSLTLVWYGTEIPVRASLGIKDYKGHDKLEDIFGAADDSLYTQKRSNKGMAERTQLERLS